MGAKNKWINKIKLDEAQEHVIADIEMGSSIKRDSKKHGINTNIFIEWSA